MPQPPLIFIAYARRDAEYLDRLRTHLKPLERSGRVRLWYDGDIEAGDTWEQAIRDKLHSADLILLLLSPDSLASDYFYEQEMPKALDRHRRAEVRVVPLILRPCRWQSTPLAELQALPKDALPITAWADIDAALDDAVASIERLLGEMPQALPVSVAATAVVAAPIKKPALAPNAPPLPAMVHIPGGTFLMGDVMEDNEVANEKPIHSVTLSDFYLGRYAVTFEEYDIFCEATGLEKIGDEGWARDRQPLVNVSWYNAINYCNWLSRQHGYAPVYDIKDKEITPYWLANGYRLPTEAEWEYAAREKGRNLRFGNGKDIAYPKEINFAAQEKYKKPYSLAGRATQRTVPVGSLSSHNDLGLYDMSGNVREWCWDWSGEYPFESQIDPRGPHLGLERILRGGSWRQAPKNCRVAFRGSCKPIYHYYDIGFRLARS